MRTSSAALSLSVCLAALVAGGCATHRQPTFGERLIAGAKPSIEVGPQKETADARAFEAYIASVKRQAAAARPKPAAPLPSVETRFPELVDALRRLRLEPTAENYRRAGEAYQAAGVLDLAHEDLSRAVKLDPTDARAFDGLARIWRDWGFPGQGLGDASRAIYHAPRSPEAYNTLGTLLQGLGRLPEARAAYSKALSLDPRAAYALNNLCYLSFLGGNGRAAVGECQAALGLAPDSTPTRNNLGLVYASLGDLQSAHREFSAAGQKARAAYNMGVTQFALRHYKDAAASLQEAFDDDPTLYRASRLATTARDRAAALDRHEDTDHERH
jgi:tetratricopeptide (TPR) repeat protein